MNPQNQYPQPDPAGSPPKPHNPLAVMQKGEIEIFHLLRHPIGLIFVYAVCGFMLIALGLSLFVVGPSLLPDSKDTIYAGGGIIFLLVTLLIVVGAFIANKVYWGNSWILTSDSITHIKQTSLFDKQQSQLSLEHIEDVTAEQNGLLPHLFGYGTLKCETAGEHSKFIFSYCPDPSKYAQQILKAREDFEMSERHRESLRESELQ